MASPDAPPSAIDVLAAGETDRGIVREFNEDAFLVRGDLGLFVVADGAGGHNAGNVASAMATTVVARCFDATEEEARGKAEMDAFGCWNAARRLSLAIQRANAEIIEIARSSNKYRGMGTTLVCALVALDTARLHVAHVGDSRCYRLRSGVLENLTPDHSILNDVVELYPELDEVAIEKLPRKAVTRALGMEARVRVALRTLAVLPGDRYLLCSDGLSGELGESVLESLLSQAVAPAEVVRELVRAANQKGGRDNVTAVVLDCVVTDRRPRPPRPRSIRPSEPSIVDGDGSQPDIEVKAATDPEIVLIEAAWSDEEVTDPRISVVPLNSADARTIRALDQLAPPRDVKCRRCGARIEGAALACPRCGHATGGPLSRR